MRYEIDTLELGGRAAFALTVEMDLPIWHILTVTTKYDRYGRRLGERPGKKWRFGP